MRQDASGLRVAHDRLRGLLGHRLRRPPVPLAWEVGPVPLAWEVRPVPLAWEVGPVPLPQSSQLGAPGTLVLAQSVHQR